MRLCGACVIWFHVEIKLSAALEGSAKEGSQGNQYSALPVVCAAERVS